MTEQPAELMQFEIVQEPEMQQQTVILTKRWQLTAFALAGVLLLAGILAVGVVVAAGAVIIGIPLLIVRTFVASLSRR